MPTLSKVAKIIAHVALFLTALFPFVLGRGLGLSQNPVYGMLLWLAAGLIAAANVWWISRGSGRKDPGRK